MSSLSIRLPAVNGVAHTFFLTNCQDAIAQVVDVVIRPDLFRGIADDVLHLLDEHGKDAAHGLAVGFFHHKLLFDRLANAAQHLFVHITGIGKDHAVVAL